MYSSIHMGTTIVYNTDTSCVIVVCMICLYTCVYEYWAGLRVYTYIGVCICVQVCIYAQRINEWMSEGTITYILYNMVLYTYRYILGGMEVPAKPLYSVYDRMSI